MSAVDPQIVAHIHAAMTKDELFAIADELVKHNALSGEAVNLFIARRNEILGYHPPNKGLSPN